MGNFKLVSDYKPCGDQPAAIEHLVEGINNGEHMQTLLGVTGSGKTFTMANVIERVNRPTLVLAHNKTLAAQLCSEFREFFPENAVEYFVSYYDYYQPEAYIPGKDMYIEKDALINDEVDRLRHSATSALFERRDVIIVASVSCIYSLGDPEEYCRLVVPVRPGMHLDRNEFISKLTSISYSRNDMALSRDTYRVRGDTVDVIPANSGELALRVEFFGDEVDRVSEINVLTGEVLRRINYAAIYPATHYAVSDDRREDALREIEREMIERAEYFKANNKLIEAQRITERTRYDLEMLREIGFCSGVENYSRVISGRAPGSTPFCLLDYFPKDWLLFVDESHVTLPQVRGMSGGDYARKKNLVEYGYRLPSAFDNRPLFFEEFESRINQAVFVSATPGDYERENSDSFTEQLIRPTGLVDPEIEVRPVEGQIDDLLGEIKKRTAAGERVLVTTLTRKMAEDLTDFLTEHSIKVKYIHFNVETIERTELIKDLRTGVIDVLVGINLLREGLDIPEVSLVAILDADKEGFLRSDRSLIQTVGRAARNVNGKVIMYADSVTGSMKRAIDETNRRRKIQSDYNDANGIVPHSVEKSIRDIIAIGENGSSGKGKDRAARNGRAEGKAGTGRGKPQKGSSLSVYPPDTDEISYIADQARAGKIPAVRREEIAAELSGVMKEAAKRLDFELAAFLRDRIKEIQK